MKVVSLKRRTRAEVIATLLATGMIYADALREYDRLQRQEFEREYARLEQEESLRSHE